MLDKTIRYYEARALALLPIISSSGFTYLRAAALFEERRAEDLRVLRAVDRFALRAVFLLALFLAILFSLFGYIELMICLVYTTSQINHLRSTIFNIQNL